MSSDCRAIERTVNKLKELSPEGFVPRVAVTLGTGLGQLTDQLDEGLDISYQELEGFAHSTVSSHSGRLHLGYWHGLPVALLSGRWHLYEGYTARQITFPVRALAQWGWVLSIMQYIAAAGLGCWWWLILTMPGFVARRSYLQLRKQQEMA